MGSLYSLPYLHTFIMYNSWKLLSLHLSTLWKMLVEVHMYLFFSFQADPNDITWHHYLEYLDQIVVDGLFQSIQCSLQYLLKNTEKGTERGPLLECKMELQIPEIVVFPDLDQVRYVHVE